MNYQTLNLLFRCNKAYGHEKLRAQDLSDTECMICSYLLSDSGCTQDDVACSLRLDKTTVAKAVLRLEEKGFLTRSCHTLDRRKKVLELTQQGREKISDIADLHEQWLKTVCVCLTEEEQAQFDSLCQRLLTAAEQLLEAQQTKHGGSQDATRA